jgi:hypothetical protein
MIGSTRSADGSHKECIQNFGRDPLGKQALRRVGNLNSNSKNSNMVQCM